MALPVDEVSSPGPTLTEKRSSRVSRTSGGQRQRLSFALAICGDPDLLFLDEPDRGPDVEALAYLSGGAGPRARGPGQDGPLFDLANLAEADALAERGHQVISRGPGPRRRHPAHIKSLVAGATVDLSTDASSRRSGPSRVRSRCSVPERSGTGGLTGITGHGAAAPEEPAPSPFQQGYAVGLRVAEADLETAFPPLSQPTLPTLASRVPMESVR
ncbi:MAG: ATP-binding cassette domain-containing protein [Actinomycetales bacterium]|nr:ATP-binding cassette domain-containing protein [Candidatus Lutibacillus vidarii]